MARSKPLVPIAVLQADRAAGMSTYAIAAKYGLAQSGVHVRLKKAGMSVQNKQVHRAKQDYDTEIDEGRYVLRAPARLQWEPASELFRGRRSHGLFGRYQDIVYRRASL